MKRHALTKIRDNSRQKVAGFSRNASEQQSKFMITVLVNSARCRNRRRRNEVGQFWWTLIKAFPWLPKNPTKSWYSLWHSDKWLALSSNSSVLCRPGFLEFNMNSPRAPWPCTVTASITVRLLRIRMIEDRILSSTGRNFTGIWILERGLSSVTCVVGAGVTPRVPLMAGVTPIDDPFNDLLVLFNWKKRELWIEIVT